MNKIKQYPFMSLAIVSLVVALGAWDMQKMVNPLVIAFVLYAALLLFLNSIQTGNLGVAKVSRKEVKSELSSATQVERIMSDTARTDIFLEKGKKDNILSPEELAEMAFGKDSSGDLVQFVALHPNTPVTTLQDLAMSGDNGILAAVASNPHTPTSVRNTILYTKLKDIYSEEAQVALLADEDTSAVVLQHIFEKPYDVEAVNGALLAHPNTPLDVFDALTDVKSWDVLKTIAGSPKIVDNAKLIAKIKGYDTNYGVTLALLTNPNMNSNTLKMFDAYNYDKGGINSIVRDTNIKLNNDVLAYVARNSPVMKNMLAERIKKTTPKYEDVPNDDLVTVFFS